MTTWMRRASVGLVEVLDLDAHKVRVYRDRLAIWRKDGQRMTWEELQAVKQSVWGDRAAVEVYPAQCEVVNLRHTRHLWSTPEIEAVVKGACVHEEFSINTLENVQRPDL